MDMHDNGSQAWDMSPVRHTPPAHGVAAGKRIFCRCLPALHSGFQRHSMLQGVPCSRSAIPVGLQRLL